MGRVVAGVEHRDRRPGAVEARLPGLGAWIWGTECSRVASTRPSRSTRTAPSASASGEPSASSAVRSSQKAARAVLVRAERRDAQHRDGDRPLRRGERGAAGLRGRRGAAAVVDDQRDGAGRGVVVLLLHQGGHVEQVPVDALGGQQPERRGRYDEDVAVVRVIAAWGTDPSGRGSSETDCRPSSPVVTRTTSPVTSVTRCCTGGPDRWRPSAGDGVAPAGGGDAESEAVSATRRRARWRRSLRACGGAAERARTSAWWHGGSFRWELGTDAGVAQREPPDLGDRHGPGQGSRLSHCRQRRIADNDAWRPALPVSRFRPVRRPGQEGPSH